MGSPPVMLRGLRECLSKVSEGRRWATVAALGDSLTAGYMSPGFTGYPRYSPYTVALETMLRRRYAGSAIDVAVENMGVNGDTAAGMRERLQSVASLAPEVVVIWAGINDLYTGRALEEVIKGIIELVQLVKQIDAAPVVCGMAPVAGSPHFNQRIRRVNAAVEGLLKEMDVIFVDLYGALSCGEGRLRGEYSDDGVHLSVDGYRVVAERVYGALCPLLDLYL